MDDIGELVSAVSHFRKQNKLSGYKPYRWQLEWHAEGKDNPERMIMAANRVGKTMTAAAETTYHLTGLYPEAGKTFFDEMDEAVRKGMAEVGQDAWPDGWVGKRYDHGILAWLGSVTNEASRDIVQKEFLGGLGEDLGTGWIPGRLIIGKPSAKQAGISDVIDKVKVRHVSGDISEAVFKTYDQGWRKWQGTAPDEIWLDEEPDENASNEKRIFSEAQTRILTSRGCLMVTFTPLLGETELVRHFHKGLRGTFIKNVTWDDAPHLDEGEKDRLKNAYPEWELETRTLGVPMMGEGRVFTVSEDMIKCAPIEIPDHWARICGIDFGIDHPAAACWIAWDRDRDIIYVYDTHRQSGLTPEFHAPIINQRGKWIPVSWPHDGMNRGKADGTALHRMYRKYEVNMLSMSARYHKDTGAGQPVEPIVVEMIERMRDGRLKIFSDQSNWFEEFRSYHRKDGLIVARKDDLMKATMYAIMMRRYAMPRVRVERRRAYARPLSSVA